MPLTVTHSTVVAVADDGTSPVGSDEWNAAHTVVGSFDVPDPITVSTVIGGTGDATLTLESTSGVGTSDKIVFKTGSQVEAARFDSTGRLIVADAGSATLAVGGNDNQIQNYGTDLATGAMSLGMFSATAANGAHVDFYRSKAATIGTATVVASGDVLGELYFYGAQQTGTFATQNAGAKVQAAVDGTVTSGAGADMPGRLAFFTTADASGTPVERLRIDSAGRVNIGNGGANVADSFSNTPILQESSTGTSFGDFRCYRADAFGAYLTFVKSRGASVGTNTAVSSGDEIGSIYGSAYDATGTPVLKNSTSIVSAVDAAPTAGSVPGRIVFSTAPSGGGTTERLRIDSSGNVQVKGGTLGYGTGVGGAQTQTGSRTTSVTLNTICGAITLFAAAPAVGTWVSFTVSNSTVAATDVVVASIKSSNGANTYICHVSLVAASSFQLTFTTVAGTTSDSPVINFAVIKAVAS